MIPQIVVDSAKMFCFNGPMLTEDDIDHIEQILDEKFDEKLSHLPNKKEFYLKMDEVMGELKTIREGQEIIGPKLYALDERVMALEEIHPSGKHVS